MQKPRAAGEGRRGIVSMAYLHGLTNRAIMYMINDYVGRRLRLQKRPAQTGRFALYEVYLGRIVSCAFYDKSRLLDAGGLRC